MQDARFFSRREFLARAALATTTSALWPRELQSAAAAAAPPPPAATVTPTVFDPPVAIFSKVYQALHLTFDQAAEVTAEAGLDGVDCPVRPGGEIIPERASEDMPRYDEALRRRKVRMLLLTTGITHVETPHAETVLRTARRLGVGYYRLGMKYHRADQPVAEQVQAYKTHLKDLAALNRQVGICGVLQNHSPGSKRHFGGDLDELYELVKDFNPAEIGVAFDLGHALIVHGDDWRRHFERLQPHIRLAYVKDTLRPRRFVPFGEGEFGKTDYFTRLKKMGYRNPLSVHIEFDWARHGGARTTAGMVKSCRATLDVLKRWLAQA